MVNLLALILLAFVVVLGIGACWAITANGAATGPMTDSFGNAPPAEISQHNGQSSAVAIATMPAAYIGFFVIICIVIAAAFAWLWKTGRSKPSKY